MFKFPIIFLAGVLGFVVLQIRDRSLLKPTYSFPDNDEIERHELLLYAEYMAKNGSKAQKKTNLPPTSKESTSTGRRVTGKDEPQLVEEKPRVGFKQD